MANIKIGEMIIHNVGITDSGDLLGLNFVTDMNLAKLDELFSPATYPEFRIVDDNDNVMSIYRNRKVITLRIDAGESGNECPAGKGVSGLDPAYPLDGRRHFG